MPTRMHSTPRLAEIARTVEPGAHALVMLDQAGWHTSSALEVPDNITLMPLPPRTPNSIPSKTSGSSCVTTGSQTASSKLRRHPRPLLPCLEQSRITARTHRFHRNPKMGTWVLNRRRWYKGNRARNGRSDPASRSLRRAAFQRLPFLFPMTGPGRALCGRRPLRTAGKPSDAMTRFLTFIVVPGLSILLFAAVGTGSRPGSMA